MSEKIMIWDGMNDCVEINGERYDNVLELEYIRDDMNIELGHEIVAYVTLGLWDGRREGMCSTGYVNMRNLFINDEECYAYYWEDGELTMHFRHHDGTNVYTFRAWKDGITAEEMEELKENFSKEKFFSMTDSLYGYFKRAYSIV